MAITLSCFRNVNFLVFYMHWWHIVLIKHQRRWAALCGPSDWTIVRDLYSSICWSKLKSFSFISKNRVNMWYIWYSDVAHSRTHTHTLSVKDAYPTNEKFRWQLWAYCGADITWTHEKAVFDWISLQISFYLCSDNHGVCEDKLLIAVAWCSSYFWSKWKHLVWMSPWNKDLGPPRELLSCCNSYWSCVDLGWLIHVCDRGWQ